MMPSTPEPVPAPDERSDSPARKVIAVLLGLCLVTVPLAAWRQHQAAAEAASPLPDYVGRDECAVWFVGSSSMRNWVKLQDDMSPWTTHNRSIGGATLPELASRFGNGTADQAPQGIVFYAGENDIAFGRTAGEVTSDFATFLAMKRRRYGAMPLLFISVKPSPTRWNNLPAQTAYNDAIRALAATVPDVSFVDIVPKFLPGGKPGDFYADDGIHLKDAGYRIWARAVRRELRASLPKRVVNRCDSE